MPQTYHVESFGAFLFVLDFSRLFFQVGLSQERLRWKRCLHAYMAFLSAELALLVVSGCGFLVISYTVAGTLEKGEWEVCFI